MLRRFAFGTVLILLAACGRDLPKADLAALSAEARLMANHASDEFRTIASLRPLRIDVRDDGVYLVMGEHFVEEWGFFIPHDGAFKPRAGGDPSFKPLAEGVWRYDIAG
jgi:hypothetical protein